MASPSPKEAAKAAAADRVASAADAPTLVLSIAVTSATTSEARPVMRIQRWVVLE
jgi:hypothetical protein